MTNVRMGEIAVSAEPDAELVALGLGSCIGLALCRPHSRRGGAGPHRAPGVTRQRPAAGKFADLAVPELLSRIRALGAVRPRLEVAHRRRRADVRARGGLDVGARNEEAVRTHRRHAGIRVRAAHTGGEQGRTLRLHVGTGRVTVRMPGAEPSCCWRVGAGRRPVAHRPAACP